MGDEKTVQNNHTEKEYRLILAISDVALRKNFKIEDSIRETSLHLALIVRFSNGIIWRCFICEYYNRYREIDIYRESGEEIILIDYELIDADISRSNYELTFKNIYGEVVFKCRETVSPSKLISEG